MCNKTLAKHVLSYLPLLYKKVLFNVRTDGDIIIEHEITHFHIQGSQVASNFAHKYSINHAHHSFKLNETNIPKVRVIKLTEPLTKLGIVFAAVDLIFVPNCSAAIVTNIAQ